MALPPRSSIAIAGATGNLGTHLCDVILSPGIRAHFSRITLLSRSPASSSPKLQRWEEQGAVVTWYAESSIAESLANVDVLVCCVGSSGYAFRDKLAQALPNTNVKLYFPSEFGVDHTVHDFPHPEWDHKKEHYELATKILSPKVKVCRVFIGLFLEDSIGPWFGFDTRKGSYESVGSPESKVSFTSMDDVARAVASLAILPPESIPSNVHLAGDTKSMIEIAQIMELAGAGKINVTSVDLEEFKVRTLATHSNDPAKSLRFLMGENKIDHSATGLQNNDELVNPKEQRWKWRTLQDLASETKGRPWGDVEWQ